jgi:filamentous hemagglutinin
MGDVVIDEKQVGHIFRNAAGHFSDDTPAARRALIEVASREENFIGTDRFGNDWFAALRADGMQLWTCVRDGKITNGGLNRTPRRDLSVLMPRR